MGRRGTSCPRSMEVYSEVKGTKHNCAKTQGRPGSGRPRLCLSSDPHSEQEQDKAKNNPEAIRVWQS